MPSGLDTHYISWRAVRWAGGLSNGLSKYCLCLTVTFLILRLGTRRVQVKYIQKMAKLTSRYRSRAWGFVDLFSSIPTVQRGGSQMSVCASVDMRDTNKSVRVLTRKTLVDILLCQLKSSGSLES